MNSDTATRIFEVEIYDQEVHESLNALLPQLSAMARPLSRSEVEAIVSSESCHLVMAKSEGLYVSCLTLVVFKIPTGVRAWIEDVVVSEKVRGKGVGKAIVEYALALAQKLGASTVDLTSRPSRKAANRLYASLGFQQRDTNVYRYKFTTR